MATALPRPGHPQCACPAPDAPQGCPTTLRAPRQRRRRAPDAKDLVAVKVGIPREAKNHEYRVAITPAGVHELGSHGHEVFIEKDAGVGSSIPDEDYQAAGAQTLGTADDVW